MAIVKDKGTTETTNGFVEVLVIDILMATEGVGICEVRVDHECYNDDDDDDDDDDGDDGATSLEEFNGSIGFSLEGETVT